MPPPDAVVGRHGTKASGCCQCRLEFGDSLPIGPPLMADGIAATGCDMGAGDNLVRMPQVVYTATLLPNNVLG